MQMHGLKTYRTNYSNIFIWLLITFAPFLNLQAQTTDTALHQLNEVIILQTKQELLQTSKKNETLDTLILRRYNTSSLADLLSSQSTIHIKSYGNGNIATSSMRGGNANHTALLWNGLNIQNPMLGQPDLSIVPGILFDNILLEYGGGSAMWGSGAIGGTIHLQNNPLFNKGFNTKLQVSVGSFNTKKNATAVLLSYKKIISSTKVYYTNSENNYKYKDTLDKEHPNKQMTHADFTTKGVLQEITFLATLYQKINIRAWYNNTFRNLPSYSSGISKQHQEDKNLKLSADWNYTKHKLNSTIRMAFFNDALNYADSLASIFSYSTAKTIIAESDNIYTHKNHSFNLGANFTQYQSNLLSKEGASDISNKHQLSKMAFFAAYKLSLLKSKLNYNVTIRKEFTSQTTIPFTGNTGIHYQLTKKIAAKINANTSFRQPTLNDLYWNPGGNPDLKPEESYEADGGLEFKHATNNFSLVIEATYFNRHTTNWIIWLPTDKAYWSPKNIAEVYSRGTETKTELAYNKNNFLVKFIVNTSYVLSTNQKATSQNDNALGRQIIYTPRYNGQATLLLNYKKLSVLFNQNYTGYRFTSTDNTSWLNPYYLANVKCSYSYSFSTVTTEIFGSINNLFNKNYAVVANRPMPLQNFEVGLSMNYHKAKKKTENQIPNN